MLGYNEDKELVSIQKILPSINDVYIWAREIDSDTENVVTIYVESEEPPDSDDGP